MKIINELSYSQINNNKKDTMIDIVIQSAKVCQTKIDFVILQTKKEQI